MDEPAASHQARAGTEPRAEPNGKDAPNGKDDPARIDEHMSRQTGQVLSRTPASGAKGFAVVLGGMVGVIGLLWLIAALVAPH